MVSSQKHRDHLAIEIGPGRLAMQAEISLHVGRRLRRPLVDGVDAQALVSFQIVEVMRPKGIVWQFHKPLFRRAQRFDERSHIRMSLRPGSSLARSSETTRAIKAYVRFGSKADIGAPSSNVRFTPESRHLLSMSRCPLCARSGRFRVLKIPMNQ